MKWSSGSSTDLVQKEEALTIYCAYCGADNIHSQECITLRPNPPKKCPECGRDQMRQFKATQWWNCDHCGFAGHDPRIK